MSTLLSFPNPVNEKAARVVAGVVALIAAAILVTGWQWLLVVLAYGFWARVLTGPALSPLGRFAMRIAAPRLGAPRYVPGPPKRFAQGIGAAVTTVAALFALALDWTTAAEVLTALMVVFATLESVFGFCVGCRIFAVLMAVGLIPDEVCADCANIWA
jgi:uncharacterized protein DUF4395